MPDTSLATLRCLSTRVRNSSGSDRVYGYLSANGRQLAPNEEFTQPGDLLAQLTAQQDATRYKALLRDLLAGTLEVSLLSPVLVTDQMTGTLQLLTVVNQSLTLVTPPWVTDLSLAAADDVTWDNFTITFDSVGYTLDQN